MRELDLLFEHFLGSGYADLSQEERERFEALLERQDDELYDWFYQEHPPEDDDTVRLVRRIRDDFFRRR